MKINLIVFKKAMIIFEQITKFLNSSRLNVKKYKPIMADKDKSEYTK